MGVDRSNIGMDLEFLAPHLGEFIAFDYLVSSGLELFLPGWRGFPRCHGVPADSGRALPDSGGADDHLESGETPARLG